MIDIDAIRKRAAVRSSVANAANLLTAPISNVARLATHSQQGPNPLLSSEDADRCHWPAWTGEEIDRTVGRVHLFLRRGAGADMAEHLAERLLLRDREQDDRRMCLECRHLTGTRCEAAGQGRVHGASRDLNPVRDLLQRCEAFEAQP